MDLAKDGVERKTMRSEDENNDLKLRWREGEPSKPWRDEWFIALTIHGDRVVLRSLPEQYSYDYTTADGTYMKSESIKKWMQFPDSHFIAPETHEIKAAQGFTVEKVRKADINAYGCDSDGEVAGRIVEHLTAKLTPEERYQIAHGDDNRWIALGTVTGNYVGEQDGFSSKETAGCGRR